MKRFPVHQLNHLLVGIERTPESKPLPSHLIRLDRNEHVGPFPEDVLRGILQRLHPRVLSDYPNPWDFYQTLSQKLGIPQDNILLVPGSDAALRSLCHVLVGGGDQVGMLEPSYAMYPVYTRMFGGKAVQIGIQPDLSVSFSELCRVCGEVKVFFLANPNQPTGALISEEQVLELVRHAEQRDAILVVDEAYFPFSGSTVIHHVLEHPHLVVVRTLSKAYGLAGLRLGFVVGAAQLVGAMYKVRPAYDVNSFAVACAEYLLEHHELVDDFVRQVGESAARLQAVAAKHGLEAPPTKANFQLIRTGPRIDPKTVSKKLEARGYVIRGPVGGGVMIDYIRVTLGYSDLLNRFAVALDEVLAESR